MSDYKVYKEEIFTIFVDPEQLRKMASDMEEYMKHCRVGQSVWSELFLSMNHGDMTKVRLVADQAYPFEKE